MYKDLITYKLASDCSESKLLEISQEVINSWMSKLKGFVKWEIHTNSDETYTDIVYWKSKIDAKNAEKEMMNIPNINEWFACYEAGSISSKNLIKIGEFE